MMAAWPPARCFPSHCERSYSTAHQAFSRCAACCSWCYSSAAGGTSDAAPWCPFLTETAPPRKGERRCWQPVLRPSGPRSFVRKLPLSHLPVTLERECYIYQLVKPLGLDSSNPRTLFRPCAPQLNRSTGRNCRWATRLLVAPARFQTLCCLRNSLTHPADLPRSHDLAHNTRVEASGGCSSCRRHLLTTRVAGSFAWA